MFCAFRRSLLSVKDWKQTCTYFLKGLASMQLYLNYSQLLLNKIWLLVLIWITIQRLPRPILLAPRFGLDDSDHSDFDATLVLATMLGSQLRDVDGSEFAVPQAAGNPMPTSQLNRSTGHGGARPQPSSQRVQQNSTSTSKSAEQSDHTKIWSEISGMQFNSIQLL